MKTAAVVIDRWKLAIFSKKLVGAGYKYEQFDGITSDSLTLKVEYEVLAKLHNVVKSANEECANMKGKNK